MRLSRRFILAVATVPGIAMAQGTPPEATDPRLAERFIGSESAPVTVTEYFSLTCNHCARFHAQTLPRVKAELLDTGKARLRLVDFPLDQLALRAAMVARSVPVERYDAFVSTLLSTQDRWAFNRAGDPKAELGKLSLLAGLAPAAFEAAWSDEALARGLLERQLAAEKEFKITATPSFSANGKVERGAISFEQFAALVAAAS